ncbi:MULTISPECIES: HigA family addiction module antitoxin [Variovorax]|uniref:HigA family addiction module antitoxin n=1 Tax=Variovorax TaxID=34072 RepID=UPI002860BBA0|nr:HigA family addiction module antitoxin [Variovorax sp. 3319]MDR6887896.1 addiction module HigA family antidote [Variovorax sp. 3319]
MATMFNPPHPGSILREDVLPALGLSVTDAATQLKISRPALSRVLNEHAAISAEMAIRLAEWLGGDAGTWMRMQADYDLWEAKKLHKVKIKKAEVAAAEDERFALAA